MCIITGDTKSVSGTRIFCASTGDGRQLTVYSNEVELIYKMSFDGSAQNMGVAMILPVPHGKAGVEFVDLSRYKTFFDDVDRLFPSTNDNLGLDYSTNSLSFSDSLPVFQVGSYKASFAPALEDLQRLRFDIFSLPPNIFELLKKTYSPTFGYVVCVLDKSAKYHPFGYIHHALSDGTLWIPAKHQHGSNYEEVFSDWSHEIYTTNTCSAMPSVEGDVKSLALVNWALLPKLEPILSISKLEMVGSHPNRDLIFPKRK